MDVRRRAEAWRMGCRIGLDFLRAALFPVTADGEALGEVRRRAEAVGEVGRSLRILSWNVHRGYGRPTVVRELLRLVRDLCPDVLFLQEVPVWERGPFWDDDALAADLGGFDLAWAPMHQVLAPTPYYDFTWSGQLTLARAPLDRVTALPLPRVCHAKLGRRHRIARLALYAALPGGIGLYNLHLENTATPGGRRRQLARTLEHVDDAGDRVVVLGGDLNTLCGPFEGLAGELERRGFTAALEDRHLPPRLDHLFVRGAARVRGRVLDARGSDHQPVLAEVELLARP